MPNRSHFFSRALVCLGVAGLLILSVVQAEITTYPESSSVFNPRVPSVAPVETIERDKVMNIAVEFAYSLAPFLSFDEGGALEVRLRDTPRRLEKTVLRLSNDSQALELLFRPASEGRVPVLRWLENGRVRRTASLGKPWGEEWSDFSLEWSEGKLTYAVGDGPENSLSISDRFDPRRVTFHSQLVDDLVIEGSGRFSMDWEQGYAARVEPAADSSASDARLFGFDAYAVSENPEARDFPVIQVSNGSGEARIYGFEFEISGEIGGAIKRWFQELKVGPEESLVTPIRFPGGLNSDVYHLTVRSMGEIPGFKERRHFFYAEPRDEAPGTAKFGLHDSNNRSFGSWPDALEIDLAHAYSYWGYVVGPAWVRDSGGEYGLDPDTPPEEWAWNERVDWHLGHGLEVYLSLQSEPFLDWMREREYPEQRLKKYEWGTRGGFPKLDLYQDFVRELAERYAGEIRYFETENEPNAGGRDKIPAEEYARIAEANYEVIHDVIPDAMIYGICGTGTFEPWMEDVFEAGGYRYMDGVSVHTYVTPQMPEEADLPAKLAEVNRLIESTGRDMPFLNSETGTYIALREQVDRPISEDRLRNLIDEGVPGVVVARGWPNYAMSEMRGSASIIRNAVYNFAAGAQRFVFFGWNPEWPVIEPGADWMTQSVEKISSGFAMVSLSRDGERTPGWHTLAVGVLVEQLKGAELEGIREMNRGGVRGAVFPKANGGEVAVLWSPLGKRTVLFETDSETAEKVSLYGENRLIPLSEGGSFSLELGEDPVYLHVDRPGLSIQRSPILNIHQTNRTDGSINLAFTLVNRETEDWQGAISFPEQEGWSFEPAVLDFDLEPRSREDFKVRAVPPRMSAKKDFALRASLSLPGGDSFVVPLRLNRRPVAEIAVAPSDEGFGVLSWEEMTMPGGRLLLNRPEQVVVGRPPKLTSIQEDQYWQGTAELSAEAKVAANEAGLYVYLNVVDAKAAPADPWPGVFGSVVEIFFDLRSVEEGFGSGWGEGVYQVLIQPALAEGDTPKMWSVRPETGTLEDAVVESGPTRNGYWVSYFVPWSSLGREYGDSRPIGFDVGINGPGDKPGTRKSQMMLFGTASNSKEASNFGVLLLVED